VSAILGVRNRQRACRANVRLLRVIVRALLREHLHLEEFELGVYLVAAEEMVRLNETFLRHKGSTDVITFDYAEQVGAVHGEIFVCLDEAVMQARRFHTRWESELTRYIVHGVLHLRGFDDSRPAHRHKMKREEDRLLRALTREFDLSKLALRKPARAPRLAA